MTFYRLGDTALVINFEQEIDPIVNKRVIEFTAYLKSKKIEGLQYFIPAFCSITIGYDRKLWNFMDLSERIKRYADKELPAFTEPFRRKLRVPVCYHEKFAPDLNYLADEKEMTVKELVSTHVGTAYRVYMMGFLPGFAYLGKLNDKLVCSRKEHPRLSVPAGSVALAGSQTGVYPLTAPGGWQVIGRTPVAIFSPEVDMPFLFATGDEVNFFSISLEEFEYMSRKEIHLAWNEILGNG